MDDAMVVPPMPAPPAEVIPLWRRRELRAATVAALAASLLLVLWLPGGQGGNKDSVGGVDSDGFTRKGDGFALSVVIDDGEGGRLLSTGDRVRGGDRLGFRVHAEKPGHLMIVGRDERGDVYPCFPQAGKRAQAIPASTTPVTLEAAIELDETPGRERIVGLLCPGAFDYDALVRALATAKPGAPLLEGCQVEELVLEKPGGTP